MNSTIETKKKKKLWEHIDYYSLYFFLVPGLILIIIFNYVPMAGIVIAFKNFNIFAGRTPIESIIKSDWVGFANFRRLFNNANFLRAFRNTIVISTYKIVFLFPVPIILAIMITDIKAKWYRKSIQTILYLPHFLSWVVVTALFLQILGPYGVINNWLKRLELIDKAIPFFGNNDIFRGLLVVSAGWKETGWNAIIYIAAITGINPQLYEAAKMDGANKIQQIIYITIPSISSTIIMLFILRVGALLDAGFDQIFNMYSYVVYEKGDILSTLVYREGIGGQDYGFGTAAGLFNSIVALVLVLGGNWLCRKFFKKGLW